MFASGKPLPCVTAATEHVNFLAENSRRRATRRWFVNDIGSPLANVVAPDQLGALCMHCTTGRRHEPDLSPYPAATFMPCNMPKTVIYVTLARRTVL